MLENDFERDMRFIYEKAKVNGYIPVIFLQMIEEHGGVETAKRLLATDKPQTGLYRLWEMGMLKDSMEALIILQKYEPLFSKAEVAEARRRLEELKYFTKPSSKQ